MDIAQLQAYGYFGLVVFLVLALYGYIYHLYSAKKDVNGIDYEEYSNIALHDDVDDTPVLSSSKTEEK
ncbi:CcoQ/FixQ family Cbb3-type cytochrome c oxidase assembly chaperone [Sulfurimonas sp.]|uniref:CcoQ/FixQ family Cbb3-type cytochrome c oxidase assembly chaperone n=1 Tax=Sulfurimonas sp. TaxID=2022749 RepID=UPI002B485835|nr:CcoQ/FixQ family Cbb3-type cytochrome c oxidase assembly chaperone [Sulfurimonas sp.]